MIGRQRQIITTEDVLFDERTAYSRNNAGAYFRGEGFEAVGDLKEIARAYFENGMNVPGEFPEVRNIIAALLA